jgi:hypothetical protein
VEDEVGEACSMNQVQEECVKDIVGKPEGKGQLGRPKRSWVDTIRMDLAEIGWSGVDWICLAQDRNRWRAVVNSVMNLQVP